MKVPLVELLQSSIDFSTDNQTYLKDFLESCNEDLAFCSKDDASVVVRCINKLMNSLTKNEKEKGLLILLYFLPQISTEALLENTIVWMNNCKKIIGRHQGSDIEKLALKTLGKLINLSVKFPELSKETTKQILPTFLLNHIKGKTNDTISLELLECLHFIMKNYSGSCAEYRPDILKLLFSTVECDADVVRAGAKCMPLVAKLGGGGKLGMVHKTSWQKQQLDLASMLHLLLDRIYEYIKIHSDVEVSAINESLFTLGSIYEEDIHRTVQRLTKQFASVAMFLQSMLLEQFPVSKLVAPDIILDVIVHAQKPTYSVLGTSREALAVTSVLPAIQVAALSLLDSLILCLGRHLISTGDLVSYLCSQVIVWSGQQSYHWPYTVEKPYRRTRIAAYSCLYSWLCVAGAASQVETFLKKSLPIILGDIHAEKPSIKLKVSSKTRKGKKKQQMITSLEDQSEKLKDSRANCHLCEQALITLTLLIRSATSDLTLENYMSIKCTVLTLITELPEPYDDINCLCVLYQLLQALCCDPHPKGVPPLAFALAVFSNGLLHNAPQVKAVCLSAVTCVEKIIHPSSGDLYVSTLRDNPRKLSKDCNVEILGKKRKIDTNSDIESIVSGNEGKSQDTASSGSEDLNIIQLLPNNQKENIYYKTNLYDKNSNSPPVEIFERLQDDSMKEREGNSEMKSIPVEIYDSSSKHESSVQIIIDKPDNRNLTSNITHDKFKNEDIIGQDQFRTDPAKISDIVEANSITKVDSDISKMLMDFNDEINCEL